MENKNVKTTTTTEENKKAVDAIVETAKKAPAKKAPAKKPVAKKAPVKGGIAASIANQRKKAPAAKPATARMPEKKAPAEKMEVKKPAPAKKVEEVDRKTEALKNSLMTLQSFTKNETAALTAAKAIASRDVDAIKAILAGLTKAERPVFMAINNAVQAEKSEKERASKAATKLDRETAERARVAAIVATLFEALAGMKQVTRKEMKAGDIIALDDIAFQVKAKTHDDIFCAFYEKAVPENKNIARFVPDYVIDNVPFPDGTRILRPVAPASSK